jgi:hypothetical protein
VGGVADWTQQSDVIREFGSEPATEERENKRIKDFLL